MAERDTLPLPLEVRARLAELELELSEDLQLLLSFSGKNATIILTLLKSHETRVHFNPFSVAKLIICPKHFHGDWFASSPAI
ncbi:hypothetical protein GN956_G15297 [Arapaima gigas]